MEDKLNQLVETTKKKKRRGAKQKKKNRTSETSKQRNDRSRSSKAYNFSMDLKTRFPHILEIDVNSEISGRVSTLLQNILKGSVNVHSTPLAIDNDVNVLLEEFDRIISTNRLRLNDTLFSIELEQRKKIGPRSIALPWKDRKSSIHENFERHDKIYKVHNTDPDLRKGTLNPTSLQVALDQLKNNTSSGLPFVTKKGKVKEGLISNFKRLLDRKDPCLLYTRTQEQSKTRSVWGFPIADTLNEMMFYIPTLAVQRKLFWRNALNGFNDLDRSITNIINHSIANNKTLVSIDFSAYDNSISPSLQMYAFDYIRKLFSNKFTNALNYINYRFTNIGIVTPDGILKGAHGVPSGSVFTNEIDSIVQFLIARQSGCTTKNNFEIQGDDGIYSINKQDVDKFINEFKDAGLSVNETKTYIENKFCVYLQNLYHVDYRDKEGIIHGIYPIYRALNRLLYQERFADLSSMGISGRDYYAIRTISILEGCKYHPLFKEFVTFIYQHDKYKLNPSIEGIERLSKIRLESEGVEGLVVNKPGDISGGLTNFATVSILKELYRKESVKDEEAVLN